MIGQRIAQYQIVEQLGEGGMGIVYRAQDTVLRREVALKLLHANLGSETELRMRLLAEARAAAALSHPNICTIFEISEAGPDSFIAMELARGRTLQAWLFESGVPSLRDLVSIAIQIAEGLAAAHAEHIVHRDLKPSNVMVDGNSRVKILDFGLAKPLKVQPDAVSSFAATRSEERGREGKVVGTVAYMSPEQALGKPVDSRSDVFAFGVLLYEMASGVRPFQGETATSTIAKILEAEPRPLGMLRDGSPPDLERVVRRCLEKQPSDRFNDTRDLVLELKALQKSIASGQTSELNAATIAPNGKSKWLPIVAWSAAAVALVAASAFIAVKLTSRPVERAAVVAASRQITFMGNASYPALSPDGQTVAFVVRDSPKQKLMVQDVTGGQAIQIHEADIIDRIRWSPDGSRLLFFAFPGGGFVVPRLGGEARPILPGVFALSWSSDGTRVVGLLQPLNRFLIANVSTGESKTVPIKKDFTFYNEVDWSPRRDVLVMSTVDDAQHTIFWTIGPDGSQQQRLLESETPLSSPRWSPTDDVLYYLRGERVKELWKLAVAPSGARQGDPVLVMAGLQAGASFSLSRDGKRFAYSNDTGHANLYRADLDSRGDPITRQLTDGTLVHSTPSISPDGTQVAFARGDGQTMNIFTMPIAGGTPKQLTFLNSVNVHPVWSPDGRQIAFASMEGGKPRVAVVGVAGGVLRPFSRTQLSGTSAELVWSPHSKITYHRPGNRNFHVLDPATEEETPLVRDSMAGWIFQPRYSPSGEQVVTFWNRAPSPGLWLISFQHSLEGEIRQLAKATTAQVGALATQALSAAPYRGKEIRVRGFLKTSGNAATRAFCYLRIDRANEQLGSNIDQQLNRSNQSAQWMPCEVTAKVDDDADMMSVGVLVNGLGKAWADEFEVDVKGSNGTWLPVPIVNPGFEEAQRDKPATGWSPIGGRQAVAAEPYKGKNSLVIETIDTASLDAWPLGWSPDGTRVYVVDRQARTVATMSINGGVPTTVLRPSSKGFESANITMSPDARHFVFSLEEGKSDVWIVDNFDPGSR